MLMPKEPYIPVSSCVYDERYPNSCLSIPHQISEYSKIEKKNNNDDNLMMIGVTGLFTGACFTALAFGGTIIAPTILTVAGIAVVGAGVGVAGCFAAEYVKNQFVKTTNLSPPPSSSLFTKKNNLSQIVYIGL